MNKIMKIAVAFIVLSVVFSSCKTTSTGPNSGGGTTLTAANPGSAFHFTVMQTDTMGNPLNTPIHQTDSVLSTGVTWAGKSNVIKDSSWDDHGTSQYGYYALLDNGDVAFYLGPLANGIVTQWITWPFGSGGSVSTTVEDLNTDLGGGASESVKEVATYSLGADSSIVVQGNTISIKQVIGTYVVTQTVSLPGTPVQTTINVLPPFHYFWAPSIGFVAGSIFFYNDGFDPPMIETQTLTSYSLK